jgi:hypothetical protein
MKRLILLMFLLIRALIFANKGNYDVTKYRQDVINYAMAQVGKGYSQANRMGANTYDCSSFVDRSSQAAGMSSVTGANTKNWANTTVSMSSGAKATKIAPNQIKPGDAILFNGHVVYAIGTANGCNIDVVHASNSKPYPQGGVKVSKGYNICKSHGGYLGVITAEQVLINNGYTPVNSDGTVAIPPTGSAIEGTGNSDSEAQTRKFSKEVYGVDWDKMSQKFLDQINIGVDKLLGGIGYFMVIMCCIDFTYYLIKKKGS